MQRFTKVLITVGIPLLVLIGGYVGVTIGYNIVKGGLKPQTQTVDATKTQEQSPPTVDELLKLVNQERAKVGVAPLKESVQLDWSAQKKADDMAKYDYFAHISKKSPNNQGDSRQWLVASGIRCVDSSENLVENIDENTGEEYDNTSAGTVEAWVKSTPHYTAMVNPDYTLTGFGINGDYVVEHFCQQ